MQFIGSRVRIRFSVWLVIVYGQVFIDFALPLSLSYVKLAISIH